MLARSAWSVLGGFALLVGGGLPAGAQGPIDDDRTIANPSFDRSALPEATSVTDSGYRNASGECVESSSGGSERTSSGTVTIGVQLSLDPATCESEYLVATYPVSDVPAKTIATFFDTRESLDALQQAKVARAAGTFYQSLTNQYRDPLFIVVSQTFAGLQWTTTGTCITSTNPQHSTYAYAGTGWYRTGYNTSSPWGCTPQASANTVASFANTAFPCPGGGTTYTNHTKTMVVGYPGGGNTWSRTQSKSGACNNLLHTNHVLFN